MFSLFKKKKETVSLKQFAEQVAAIATKYNKNHWHARAGMNAFGETTFSGYVPGIWTNELKTPEAVIEQLVLYCEGPQYGNIVKEVII